MIASMALSATSFSTFWVGVFGFGAQYSRDNDDDDNDDDNDDNNVNDDVNDDDNYYDDNNLFLVFSTLAIFASFSFFIEHFLLLFC